MTATSGFQKEIPQFDSVRAGSDWMSGCGLSKVVLSHPLHFIGKGSAEHQSLSLGLRGQIGLLNDSPNLGLEAHIQHPVGLIQNQHLNVCKSDALALDEIVQPSGCPDNDVHAVGQLLQLVFHRLPAVNARTLDLAVENELPCLRTISWQLNTTKLVAIRDHSS